MWASYQEQSLAESQAHQSARAKARGTGGEIFPGRGAVGGAVVGSMIEEKATRAQGLELTIKMDSGKTLSIVQEVDSVNSFIAGQRVRVLTQGALARVSPK